MNEIDLKLIYERFNEIDRQLTQLRKEVDEMLPKKKPWVPQWEEHLSDNEQWDEANK
jgi:hypothetical protein